MKRTILRLQSLYQRLLLLFVTLIMLNTANAALNITQTPLFLLPSTLPIVMLNLSKDHQLYFKAYDDYSDLDGDGLPETTYKHSFNYYGYFDSYKCYDFVNGRFIPTSLSINKYCSARWSGNFLNWATMTRIDTLRKILYGGLRSKDGLGDTELERSYLPNDAHSFAKFYTGDDLDKLTPFTTAEVASGITLCNTTITVNQAYSQDVDAKDPPLMRVAKGNFSLWADNERWQCLWAEENRVVREPDDQGKDKPISNGNIADISGIAASPNNPTKLTDGLGLKDYPIRVKICADENLKGNDNCKSYKNNATGDVSLKPIGLLQTYGDEAKMRFGLVTGSYDKSKSGGVLRKNAELLTNEINVDTDGTFKPAPDQGGIIDTLNKLRIYGYRHNGGTPKTNGTYVKCIDDIVEPDNCTVVKTSPSDDCNWGLTSFTEGQCSNWGNPQAEIFLESLRYLAGKSASPTFLPANNIKDKELELPHANVEDPISADYCASLNIVQINAAANSYDADELSEVTDVNANNPILLTDRVGAGEDINGKAYIFGDSGSISDNSCTIKTVNALSNILGLCPESTSQQGSYHISGLAHHAHIHDIRPTTPSDQLVTTYGITLATNKPEVTVSIPGSTQKITLAPACQRHTSITDNSGTKLVKTDCALVDFKIVSQNNPSVDSHATGKLYVNWEDSQQGGDFDQDMWGVINYDLSATQVKITTDVVASSSKASMGFGYVINGTNRDGFHAHSGANSFQAYQCQPCEVSDPATTTVYGIENSNTTPLEEPLYYAAKWGSFLDGNGNNKPDLQTEWDLVNNSTGLTPGDGIPDHYFLGNNPKLVETALDKTLAEINKTQGSSTAIISNSGMLSNGTLLYQSKFNSANWTGQLLAFSLDLGNGDVNDVPKWNAGETLTKQGFTGRNLFGYNPETAKGIDLLYGNLSTAQQALLTEEQLNFIRGDQSNETPNGVFRSRTDSVEQDGSTTKIVHNRLLGDIINSEPLYIGPSSYVYEKLPSPEGGEYLNYIGSSAMLKRTPMIAVGANDGMLHVFDASADNQGKEIFGFVPSTLMGKLAALTSPSYIAAGQHHYFVDGSPNVGDAFFDSDGDTHKEWRTTLLGTLGAGGKGIFALDVTFLSADYLISKPEFTNKQVLWEINNQFSPVAADLTDNISGFPAVYGFANNLGYTLGQASVIRMANGQFAALFGNGYDSTNQTAILYIVDIKTGAIIRSISTETSGDNGLSSPLAVDVNKDSIIDAIYAGDLLGNFWKFDVSSSNANDWKVAYTDGTKPAPLFTAQITGQTGQPITVQPSFAIHPTGGLMLFFGTGSYFKTGDNIIGSAPPVQSFYGLWDACINFTGATKDPCSTNPIAGRSALVAQTIDNEFNNGRVDIRISSNNAVSYPNAKGWYMDLVTPPQPGITHGERVISKALVHNRRLIFITNTPNNNTCDANSDSWLVELNPLTGGRLDQTPFDISGDKIITKEDQVGKPDNLMAVSALKKPLGIVKGVTIVSGGTNKKVEYKYMDGIQNNGKIDKTIESNSSVAARQSWAQLR